MEIVDKVYDVVPHFSKEEKYGKRSQRTRGAISISANIAEGSAKVSERDYSRYDLIALLQRVVAEQKMLQSFIRKLD